MVKNLGFPCRIGTKHRGNIHIRVLLLNSLNSCFQGYCLSGKLGGGCLIAGMEVSGQHQLYQLLRML